MSHPLAKARKILAFTLMCAALGACEKPTIEAPKPRPALTYTLTADNANSLEAYTGDIRARIEADHAFRTSGKIIKRHVALGATVKRGQLLAELDPQDAALAADAARAQVTATETEADFAKAELARTRDLFAKGFVSQSALDQKINLANAANARLNAQRASARVSANQAGYAVLKAELDGVVTHVFAEAGQVTAAGQPVMKIANPRERELAIAVPESKVALFRGANASRAIAVRLANDLTVSYPARVREIAAAADPLTRTYAVRVAIESADPALQLGMSAVAGFTAAPTPGTWVVPLSAVAARTGNAGVWRIASDGKVSFVGVSVSQYREASASIRSDLLKAGDVIVAIGVQKLIEGETLTPIVEPAVVRTRQAL